MSAWDLNAVLAGLHDEVQQKLATARGAFGHPVEKGDASEGVWLELLQRYLPKRYEVLKATVVDSEGTFSDQIDVVILDRQYSPFILKFQDQYVVPAESIYAVFEAKQAINAEQVAYADKKISSVRNLVRTSLPIPHAGGTYPAKEPQTILGGILTFESDWKPSLGAPLVKALGEGTMGALDLGCVAAHGIFSRHLETGGYDMILGGKPATAFLFELIARLQNKATVPMVDIRAYAKWLN